MGFFRKKKLDRDREHRPINHPKFATGGEVYYWEARQQCGRSGYFDDFSPADQQLAWKKLNEYLARWGGRSAIPNWKFGILVGRARHYVKHRDMWTKAWARWMWHMKRSKNARQKLLALGHPGLKKANEVNRRNAQRHKLIEQGLITRSKILD